jgi:hypothetical protein
VKVTRPPRAIPLVELEPFAVPARRTTALRAALGIALVAALVAVVLAARTDAAPAVDAAPAGASLVVVVDLSLSIPPATLERMRSVLERVAAGDRPIGLVLFSDAAYELLPPRTPPGELRSMLRHLTPTTTDYLANPEGPLRGDPWTRTFRGGTRISGALVLAGEMLGRSGGGSILLISDLHTADADAEPLRQELVALRKSDVELRVAALNALPEHETLFRRQGGAVIHDADVVATQSWTAPRPARAASSSLPLAVMLAAAVLLALLAGNELACGRLELPRLARREADA